MLRTVIAIPFLLATVAPLTVSAAEQPTVPPADEQIAAAVLAAPEARRAGAGVLGYDEGGALVRLREGSNGLLCLADDPADERFQVACYPESLDPFMARGRALRAEGVDTGKARNEIRWKEIEDGTLAMPQEPTTLHILDGEGFDASAGTVASAYRRWVIYVPYATAESTGLGTEGSDSEPWLMVAGTPSAHIMITPPRPPKKD